jgi:predicted RND superfamily exporter protein
LTNPNAIGPENNSLAHQPLGNDSFAPEHSLLGVFARRPLLSLAVVVVMTALSMIGYRDPSLLVGAPADTEASSVGGMSGRGGGNRDARPGRSRGGPARNTNQNAPPPDVAPLMLFGSELMLLIHGEGFFTPTAALAIREAVSALEALPQIRDVMWMDRAPPLNLFGLREPALPDHRASQRRFDSAKETALANPLIAGQLLSTDGRTMLLSIEVDWFYVRSNADCTTVLVKTVKDVLQSHKLDFEVGVTGEMPIRLVMSAASQENDRKFQYIAYGVILILATILFRGPSAVVITAVAPALGVFWTMGCIRFLHFEDNPFNHVVVPVLLSLVGFTDGVHMMTQIRVHRSSGMPVRAAVARSLDEVGAACFLTSLTTAIGFASLSFAHHQVVREFGWCCVLGVGITFLAIIAAIPLACFTPLGRSVHRGQGSGWIEKNLDHATNVILVVLRRRKLFATVAIVATLGTAIISSRLEPDERILNAIPERSHEAKWLRHIDKAFGGLETAYIRVSWNDSVNAQSPEVVQVSNAVEQMLREEPLLGSPLGIARLIDALPGDAQPSAKAALLDLLPPPLRRVFLLPEQQMTKVIFRLQDLGIAKYGPVFERILMQLVQLEAKHPDFELSLEGGAVWRWRNLYQIMVDLTKSLGTASVVIFIVLSIVYRSLRLGMIAIIPNLLPLTVTGAGMWLFGQSLELVSVLAFTVCLGIAVDDTIHFMTRYRFELARRVGTQEDAIERAFRGVGAAMIMTTLVVVCGFTTVLWSDTREHHIFAMMGGCTIATALLADMFFLPALIAVFDRKSRT